MIYHLVMYNSSPWKINPFLRTVNHGKPSISMGRLYHGCDNPKIFSTSTKGFSSHFDDILRQGTIRIATSGSMYLTAAKKGVCLRQSKHGLLDNSPLGLTIYSANNFHPMFSVPRVLVPPNKQKNEKGTSRHSYAPQGLPNHWCGQTWAPQPVVVRKPGRVCGRSPEGYLSQTQSVSDLT